MELPKPNIHTKTHGHLQEQSFGLSEENMGMIFDILRNKMYSNPHGAIAREIASNSRDAHKEVGKEGVPIEITLPTAFDPNLKFRDRGPGISPERMTNVFLKYTASTKRDNNEQIGGFGIGAKTPFAYTDSFSIITVVDGVQRTYQAYIDESQIGKMALARESETNECNGTTIVVPVDKADIRKFCEEVIYATQYWDVRPKLKNAGDYRYPLIKKLLQGNGWSLKDEYRSYDSKATALISGIPYPIERSNIKNCDNIAWDVAANPVVLDFDIGELSLIASRERIHYDERTQKVLSDRLAKVGKDVIKRVRQDVEKATSYLEARKIRSKHNGILRGTNITQGIKDVKWQGHTLLETITAADIGKECRIRNYTWNHSISAPKAEKTYQNYGQTRLDVDTQNTFIYHNDRDVKTVSRGYIEAMWNAHPGICKLQIILTPKEDSKDKKAEYDTTLLKLIGTNKISKITPVKKPRVVGGNRYKKTVKTNVTAYKLYESGEETDWTIEEVSNEDGGIYVIVDNSVSFKSGKILTKIKQFYYNYSTYETFIGEQIYGFTPTRAKKLSKNWKKFDDIIDKRVEDFASKFDLDKIKEVFDSSYWLLQYHTFIDVERIIPYIKDNDNPIKKAYTLSAAIQKVIDKYSNYVSLLRALGKIKNDELLICGGTYYTDQKRKDTSGLKELIKEINDRYPMLKIIDRYESRKNVSVISDYINIMDKNAAKTAPKKKKD